VVAFELKGWELVIAGVPDAIMQSLPTRARRVTPLAHGRFTLELSPEEPPERLLQELAAQGVRVISLNPVRATLEDYFVRSVAAARPREQGS
jgi:hypothetical protein